MSTIRRRTLSHIRADKGDVQSLSASGNRNFDFRVGIRKQPSTLRGPGADRHRERARRWLGHNNAVSAPGRFSFIAKVSANPLRRITASP
jgi:hypothetical protein